MDDLNNVGYPIMEEIWTKKNDVMLPFSNEHNLHQVAWTSVSLKYAVLRIYQSP